MTATQDTPVEATPPARGRFTRQRRPTWVIIGVLMLVEVISAFETSMVYAAVPTFIREFHSDAATVGWAVTAFLLVAASSAVSAGGAAPTVAGLTTVATMMIVLGLVTIGFTLLIRRGRVTATA